MSKQPIAAATADCVLREKIMLCILTRLPVKSLLRFKSVCSPWRKLFATPEFRKMHRHQFSDDPKNEGFILDRFSQFHDHTFSLFSIESAENKSTNLNCPYSEEIVGCCSGLLCVPFGEGIVLWNPALKLSKFVQLPKVDSGVPPAKVSLGFGYDAEGDDYKVVRICCFEYESNVMLQNAENVDAVIELYSSRSDSWKRLRVDLQFKVFDKKNEGIANGNPYWKARVYKKGSVRKLPFLDLLLWIDVKKLVLKTLRMTKHLVREYNGTQIIPKFVDWKGSLAAIVCSENEERVESFQVWVVDESEGKIAWRLNQTFGPIEIQVSSFFKCSNNGKIVWECGDAKLVVFDIETRCVKAIETDEGSLFYQIYGYSESLACIEGMEPVAVHGSSENGRR